MAGRNNANIIRNGGVIKLIKESRYYKRDSFLLARAKISVDGHNWSNAEVCDVSFGGLKFYSDSIFEIGDVLWFDLTMPEYITTYDIKVQATILREDHENSKRVYGVTFKDLNPELNIRIDEIIQYKERLLNEIN